MENVSSLKWSSPAEPSQISEKIFPLFFLSLSLLSCRCTLVHKLYVFLVLYAIMLLHVYMSPCAVIAQIILIHYSFSHFAHYFIFPNYFKYFYSILFVFVQIFKLKICISRFCFVFVVILFVLQLNYKTKQMSY